MRLKLKTWVVVSSAVVLGGFGIAAAQSGNPAAPAPATATSEEEIAKLTPQEMLQRAAEYPKEMDESHGQVKRMLGEAKKEHDVVKVLCLDDKHKQMEVAKGAAKDRLEALRSAVQRPAADKDGATHEFTILNVLRERIQTLLTEANQCVGEDTDYTGKTTLTVDIDPGLPDVDPSKNPDDNFVVDPPVLSSPTF
jgi:hypothetical protein